MRIDIDKICKDVNYSFSEVERAFLLHYLLDKLKKRNKGCDWCSKKNSYFIDEDLVKFLVQYKDGRSTYKYSMRMICKECGHNRFFCVPKQEFFDEWYDKQDIEPKEENGASDRT